MIGSPGGRMLRDSKEILGCSLGAQDGMIGTVSDFFLDDEVWVIRYLVVDTGVGAAARKVLIMPVVLGRPDWDGRMLSVTVTREQVLGSPDIDTGKPVSRQQEMGYRGYYGYGKYWGSSGLFNTEDPHLRSGNVLLRHFVHASDGDVGHVNGFIIDDRSWAIQFLVVQTGTWWPGNQVRVAPELIDEVSWEDCVISLGSTRQAVRNSPRYESAVPFSNQDQSPGDQR